MAMDINAKGIAQFLYLIMVNVVFIFEGEFKLLF